MFLFLAEAYEDHIRHLNQQLKELQDQTSIVVQERSSVFSKLKSNFQADENINAQLIKELKEQLRHEQDKLQKALERVNRYDCLLLLNISIRWHSGCSERLFITS